MITVVQYLWFDPHARCNGVYVYGAADVNSLKRQVDLHMSVPHRHVCVTNKPQGLDCDIDVVPLDMTTFIPGTRFAKLMSYRPDAASVFGGERLLILDIDAVAVGNLDPLVQRDEDLVLWRNPNFGIPRRARYNTSIVLVKAGTRPEFWTKFDPSRSPRALKALNIGGTDQAWVSHMASAEEAHWTAADGVYGAGRLGDYNPGSCTTSLPVNARIVFFPGRRVPWMQTEIEKHPWIPEHRT